MKKKILSVLLTGVMATSLFAGCGTSSTAETTDTTSADTATTANSEPEETTSEETATADAAAEGTTEVEFWYAGGKTAVNVVQEIIDDYNASQSTYHVSAVTQADYSETYEKLQAAIAGNAAPDLVLLNPDSALNLDNSGLLADINTFIDADSDMDVSKFIQVFADEGVDDNGVRFAFPAYGTTQVLYYNVAAFEEAGIDPDSIKTWQDLADAAKAIKDTGDYEYGWEPMWGPNNLIDAAFSNGGTIFNEDGTEVMINSDEWVEAWEAFGKWINEDEIMAVNSGGQGWEYWYNTIDDVLDGTAGGYTGSSGDQADLDFSIVQAMEQPAFDEDSTSAPQASALTLSVLASASDAEQAGAYDFIKFFTNAESQTKWTMATGYVPVNTEVNDNADYQAYIAENPQASVPLSQAAHATTYPVDPTGGVIYDALNTAADKVELEGTSAKEALDEAQATAQAALDEALGK